MLIHAAAGGTEQAAVRRAKHCGATVIATASRSKHDTVLALGADHVLDSARGDLVSAVGALTGAGGVDVVLESAGGATLADGPKALAQLEARATVGKLAPLP